MAIHGQLRSPSPSMAIWLAAGFTATAADLALALARGFVLRTDKPLLLATLLGSHLLLCAVPLLLVLLAGLLSPAVGRWRRAAPWTLLLAAALLPMLLLRVRRLTEPLSMLPEIGLLVLLLLLAVFEPRRAARGPGRVAFSAVILVACLAMLLMVTLPLPGRGMLARPVAGKGSPAGPETPNLLLIVLDTLRADRLGLYGHPRPTSPFLDSLAAEAEVFEHAVSSSSWTLPAHATLFTGLLPWAHGTDIIEGDAGGLDVSRLDRVKDPMRVQPLSPEAVTLAEVARDGGLETAAICGNTIYLYDVFQLDQGFDTYVDAPGNRIEWVPAGYRLAFKAGLLEWWPFRRAIMRNEQPDRHADEVNRLALRWLDARPDRRFFLFLNYMDAHGPYFMPMSYASLFPLSGEDGALDQDAVLSGRREILPRERDSKLDSYDAEIRYLDDQLAALFEGLQKRDLLDDTVIMIVGDHGESFGEHHDLGHGNSVYESEVHVPMMLLRLDRKGSRVSRTVNLAEAFGTLLQELRLPLPEASAPASLGPQPPADPPVSFVTHWPPMADDYERYNRSHAALFEDPWKLVEHSDGARELYDLSRDPTETQDLAAAEPQLVDRLSRRLHELRAGTTRRFSASDGRLDQETLRRLRTLGYVD